MTPEELAEDIMRRWLDGSEHSEPFLGASREIAKAIREYGERRAKEEREACAAVAEGRDEPESEYALVQLGRNDAAAAIRARK